VRPKIDNDTSSHVVWRNCTATGLLSAHHREIASDWAAVSDMILALVTFDYSADSTSLLWLFDIFKMMFFEQRTTAFDHALSVRYDLEECHKSRDLVPSDTCD
jgi:hypothetical protein